MSSVYPVTANIQKVYFAPATDENITRDSFVKVNTKETFKEREPVMRGLYDNRMGRMVGLLGCCETCLMVSKSCTGHPGHIDLNSTIVNPLLAPIARYWTRVLCLNCGNPIIKPKTSGTSDDFTKQESGIEILKKSGSSQTQRKCPVCGEIHPIIRSKNKKSDASSDVHSNELFAITGEKKVILEPAELFRVFDSVDDKTVREFGQDPDHLHPRNLFLRNIRVPSVNVRPSIKNQYSSGQNNISVSLQSILVNSQSKASNSAVSRQAIYDFIMKRADKTQVQRSAAGILQDLRGKHGILRGALMGKIVFNLSRNTISGNCQIKIDEVGIPLEFAKTLFVREVVHAWNLDRMRAIYLNGASRYPGCVAVHRRNTPTEAQYTNMIDVNIIPLEIGDTVVRHLVDGDIVYFNRNPTLERSSIGAHKVKVFTDPTINTFQMNPTACAWYNADFDGDQMAMYSPQRPASIMEAHIISNVRNWLISTKTSGIALGEIMDSILGIHLLSIRKEPLSRYQVERIFANNILPVTDLTKDTYTGKEIISLYLTEYARVNMKKRSAWGGAPFDVVFGLDDSECTTIIENGELKQGSVDKKIIGTGKGSLFHLVMTKYNSKRTYEVLYDLQQMAINYLYIRGFTMSAYDLYLPQEIHKQLQLIVESRIVEANRFSESMIRGDITPPIGMTVRQFYERQMMEKLKVPDNVIENILRGLESDPSKASNSSTTGNNLIHMIRSGSKGNISNAVHILSTVGQITINSARMEEGFAFRRTLPYFPRYSVDPRAYGFIANGYVKGLTSSEYVFLAMNSRFDMISRSLSTAKTGYQTRKNIKSMESLLVTNTHRIESDGKIVQLLYGNDGLDSRKVIDVPIPQNSDEQIAEFAADEEDARELREMRDKTFESCAREERRQLTGTAMFSKELPINVTHRLADCERCEPSDPAARLARVKQFCTNLGYVFLNKAVEVVHGYKLKCCDAAVEHMITHIRFVLNNEELKTLSDQTLETLLRIIANTYAHAQIAFGTSVGVLAAQSICEFWTQYMLDATHRSVKGGTTKSGFDQFIEITSAAPKNAESSAMMILYPTQAAIDARKVENVAKMIEMIRFRDIVETYSLLLENIINLKVPKYTKDQEWINEVLQYKTRGINKQSKWCLRVVMNKLAMINKNISLEQVTVTLLARLSEHMILSTAENSEEVVIRIWLSVPQRYGKNEVIAVAKEILNMTLRGIRGIYNTEVKTRTIHKIIDGRVQKIDHPIIVTDGSNLRDMITIRDIDHARTTTSSINDVYETFGIAATRRALVYSLKRVFGEGAPSERHLLMFASEMIRSNGILTSLEPAGISKKNKDDIFLQMVMGKPIQHFQNKIPEKFLAPTTNISGALCMGEIPNIGTYYNSVLVDTDAIRRDTKSIDDMISSALG